jgi:hypothetical protein
VNFEEAKSETILEKSPQTVLSGLETNPSPFHGKPGSRNGINVRRAQLHKSMPPKAMLFALEAMRLERAHTVVCEAIKSALQRRRARVVRALFSIPVGPVAEQGVASKSGDSVYETGYQPIAQPR